MGAGYAGGTCGAAGSVTVRTTGGGKGAGGNGVTNGITGSGMGANGGDLDGPGVDGEGIGASTTTGVFGCAVTLVSTAGTEPNLTW